VGLEICALGSYYKAMERTEYCGVVLNAENQVRTALLLGTKVIRIWAGNQNYDECAPKRRERILQDISDFAAVAEAAGVIVVLERHNNSLTNSWESPGIVLDALCRANVRLNYQIVHPATGDNYRAHSVADYCQYLRVSSHAHLQNYREQADGTLIRTFLDDGVVDYSQLGIAAARAGYNGFFCIEFLPDMYDGYSKVDALRRDIRYLRGLPDGETEVES